MKRDRLKDKPFHIKRQNDIIPESDMLLVLSGITSFDAYPGFIYTCVFNFPENPHLRHTFSPSVTCSTLYRKASDHLRIPLYQTTLIYKDNLLPNSSCEISSIFHSDSIPEISVLFQLQIKATFPKNNNPPVIPTPCIFIKVEIESISNTPNYLIRTHPQTPLNQLWKVMDESFPGLVAVTSRGWAIRPRLGESLPKSGTTVSSLRDDSDAIHIELYEEEMVRFVSIQVDGVETTMYVLQDNCVQDTIEAVISSDSLQEYEYSFPDVASEEEEWGVWDLPISAFAVDPEEVVQFTFLSKVVRVEGEISKKIPYSDSNEITIDWILHHLEFSGEPCTLCDSDGIVSTTIFELT